MVSKKLNSGQEHLDSDKTPPDPRRHVVLLAVFFFFVIEAGVLKSFGVLLSPLVFQLDSNYATVGALFSLPWSVEYICAVVIRSLVNHTDLNMISIAGGLIAGVAMTTSSFTRTTLALAIPLIFFGIGQSMLLIPAIICLHRHYKENFAFACSFVLVGSLVGVLIVPIATELLIEAYGPHSALFLLGGICLNMFPIGLVLKLPKEKHKRSPADVCEHLLEDIDTCSAPSTTAKVHYSNDNVNHANKVECGILQNGSNVLQRSKEKGSPNPDKMADFYKMGEETNVGGEIDTGMVSENFKTSNFGSTKRQSDSEVDTIKDVPLTARRKISKKVSNLKTFAEEAKFFLAFILPCDVLGLFTFMSWTLFIVPFAISEGIPETQAVFVGTMGGVGGLVSRVLGTVILHFHPTWVSGQYVVFCSLTSLMLFLQPLKTSYNYTLACSFFLGFGLYGSRCLFEALVSNVVKPDIFPTAISITYLFSGVSGILTAYNSGSLYDMSESYVAVFYILGVLEAVNVGIFLLLLVIKKRLRIRQNPDME
nr:uncharacterized protein LOC129271770 [Lytechinus pictus]